MVAVLAAPYRYGVMDAVLARKRCVFHFVLMEGHGH